LARRIQRILESRPLPQLSRRRIALVSAACVILCTAIASGTLDHAQPHSSVKHNLTPQKAGTAAQAVKFILGDLKIDSDVHDRDGVRDRVLKASKGREYTNRKELTNEAAERIRADFQERGYFQAVVQIPSSQPLGFADGKQSFRVIASITEGDQFRLKNISIQSVAPDQALSISAQTLRGQFHLRDGDLFNMAELREGLERLQDLYVNRGYARATAIPDTSIDNASHRIELTIRITEGPHAP